MRYELNPEFVRYFVTASIGFVAGGLVTGYFMKQKYELILEDIYEQTDKMMDDAKDILKESGQLMDDSKELLEKNDYELLKDIDDAEKKLINLEKEKYKRLVRNYSQPDDNYLDGKRDSEEVTLNAKAPYVISLEDFSDGNEHFDKVTLMYYTEDDILCYEDNEEEDIITNEEPLIGVNNLSFGEDEMAIYIRNELTATDYEIIRLDMSYSETVLGIPEVDEPQKHMRRRDPDED